MSPITFYNDHCHLCFYHVYVILIYSYISPLIYHFQRFTFIYIIQFSAQKYIPSIFFFFSMLEITASASFFLLRCNYCKFPTFNMKFFWFVISVAFHLNHVPWRNSTHPHQQFMGSCDLASIPKKYFWGMFIKIWLPTLVEFLFI